MSGRACVDYDGLSLSDTSSFVSLDKYKNRNSSGSSLSLSFASAAHTEPKDDSITVSSRDTGLLVQKTKTVMNGGSGSTVQDFHTLYSLESESHASAFDERYPADPSAVFERLKLSNPPSPSSEIHNGCATRRRALSTAS
ncbi:hypothetical protein DFH11DRAFT_1596030, partial [Phellopilus nigrolimitatus]